MVKVRMKNEERSGEKLNRERSVYTIEGSHMNKKLRKVTQYHFRP